MAKKASKKSKTTPARKPTSTTRHSSPTRHPERSEGSPATDRSKLKSKAAKSPLRQGLDRSRAKIKAYRAKQKKPSHRSFHRSYREDYAKPDNTPGLFAHATATLMLLGKHWKLFGSLLVTMIIASIVLLGILSEQTYTSFQTAIDETASSMETGDVSRGMKAGLLLISSFTSGGLSQTMSETQRVLTVIVFLTVWLVTIFLLRHLLAGHKLKMRDALYSAMAPAISTLMIFVTIFVQLVPVFLVIIAYSAAVASDFLSTPFYAFMFWLVACALGLLSAYLISSSLIALVAVTVPGTRPLDALNLASALMDGRRIRFLTRILFLAFLIVVALVAIIFPIVVIDLALKQNIPFLTGWPIVPFALLAFSNFFFIYGSAYIYLYYRKLIDEQS